MNAVIKLSSPATHEFWEIPVLFEDDHLLALDKPAGLLTSPNREALERANLMNLLHTGIAAGKAWVAQRNLTYLSNAHRLDSETSGVLLLAKSKAVLVALANLFSSEKIIRKYLALAQGEPREKRFTIDAKLAPHPLNPGLMCVDPKRGKKSCTSFEVLEQFRGYVLLKCDPLTERTHQIRAHLHCAGFPIAGDSLYGGRPLLLSRLKRSYRLKEGHVERPLLSRAGVHAEQLLLPHPVSGELITVSAPWPKDLKVALKYLQEFAI